MVFHAVTNARLIKATSASMRGYCAREEEGMRRIWVLAGVGGGSIVDVFWSKEKKTGRQR